MVIYSRFGEPVAIERTAVLADVQELDKRRPDKVDKEAIAIGSYVIVRFSDGRRQLTHQAYLRADGASLEIGQAIKAADAQENPS